MATPQQSTETPAVEPLAAAPQGEPVTSTAATGDTTTTTGPEPGDSTAGLEAEVWFRV